MEQINKVLDQNAFLSSTWTFVIIGISCIAYLFYASYIHPMTLFTRLGIKGPIPRLVLGNLLDNKSGLHQSMITDRCKYGKIYGTYLGTRPTLWIADPDILKTIMVKDFQNFADRVPLTTRQKYPLKYSVLFATGDDWKRIRSILTTTFSASKLKQIFPIVDNISDRCVERILATTKNKETPDIKAIYRKFTMEVITATAFGVRVDNDPRGDKLVNVAAEIFNSVAIFQLIVVLAPSFEPLLRQFLFKRNYAVKYLTNTIRDIIRERRQCLENGTPCNRDLLQLMLEATENGKLSNDEIIGQSYVFMIAGYETSSNTLTFATYLLAIHPDIQDKLYTEITQKYEEKGVLDYDTISELQYLDMVLSETLRMYPPGYASNRKVNNDITINGIPIKEEMTIGIPIYGIHYDPEYWPDPDKFNPDRFTTEAKQARNPFTYMPFGAGPRNCIGMRLALIETKLALAKILKAVEIFVIDKTEIPLKVSSSATLSPTNGVYVGIKQRS